MVEEKPKDKSEDELTDAVPEWFLILREAYLREKEKYRKA
jgi:hypothetical protein